MATENHKSHKARNVTVLTAIGIVLVFLLGFIPQYWKVSGLQNELQARDQRIAQLQRSATLSKARDLAALLHLELTRKNYGSAEKHATALFNHFGEIASDPSFSALKGEIENVLGQRDAVIADIAKADPAIETRAREILERTHQLSVP